MDEEPPYGELRNRGSLSASSLGSSLLHPISPASLDTVRRSASSEVKSMQCEAESLLSQRERAGASYLAGQPGVAPGTLAVLHLPGPDVAGAVGVGCVQSHGAQPGRHEERAIRE